MSSHVIEDLTSSILDFQANVVRISLRKKTTPVDPERNQGHFNTLRYIWASSKLEEQVDEQGQPLQWRRLGFETEDLMQEFADVGVLGLDCLVGSGQSRRVNTILNILLIVENIRNNGHRLFCKGLVLLPCLNTC
jgi:ELMO/CED-12 family